MTTIQIEHNGEKIQVDRNDYIRAKTLDLQEFGYPNLTEEDVRNQLDIALSGEGELDVIGMFIDGDLVKEV